MEDLSEIAALSLRTLERVFKKETGLTLSKYQQMLRIIKSLELLSDQEWTISEIAFKTGYKSLQAYTNSFFSVMQYRPSEFLKKIDLDFIMLFKYITLLSFCLSCYKPDHL